MTISPQLQAMLILKSHNYIGDMGLPKYVKFDGGLHHFILQNGDEVKVDLVTKRLGE